MMVFYIWMNDYVHLIVFVLACGKSELWLIMWIPIYQHIKKVKNK